MLGDSNYYNYNQNKIKRSVNNCWYSQNNLKRSVNNTYITISTHIRANNQI